MSFHAGIASTLLCVSCHRVYVFYFRADLVFQRQRVLFVSFRAGVAPTLLCVSCHRVCVFYSRADLVFLRQHVISLSFRADVAKLLQASPCQRRVAKGHPRWFCKIHLTPNRPPEPLAVTFPSFLRLFDDLFSMIWTLNCLLAELGFVGFRFCSVLSLQIPSLFAFAVLDCVSEWFLFASSLLAILACPAELRSHSSCRTCFPLIWRTVGVLETWLCYSLSDFMPLWLALLSLKIHFKIA